MRVAMIGAGYVGLVSGACFADFGRLVCCVDTDETKIAALEGGRMPIYEPGLEALVETNVRAKRLTFTGDLKAAVGAAEAVFIAVGTRRGAATATPIFPMSIRQRATSPGRSPVIRSSSPNGRCRSAPAMRSSASSARPARKRTSPSSPTRNSCAKAPSPTKRPDRIVISTQDERAAQVM